MTSNDSIHILATDTVPGLFCDACSDVAITRIFAIKKRGQNKPFAIFLHDIDQIWEYAEHSAIAEKLAHRFLPGPLSLVLPYRGARPGMPNISAKLISPDGFIGIRIPNDLELLARLRRAAHPLAATSVNFSGVAEARQIGDIADDIKRQVDFVGDGLCSGTASTVVKVDGAAYEVLRAGAIAADDIARALSL